MKNFTQQTATLGKKLWKSVWLFPVVCTFILLLLTAGKVHGSSIGFYGMVFNGSAKDSNILAGKPRAIRSDEWVWNSQMIIAQSNNDFERINTNFGDGQDMSVIIDVPYKDWSMVFRPQNLGFFALPFDYAFAFKWWLMSYMLLMAAYFFILSILPGRRLIAASIAMAILYSAFVQWWYQYITIAPLTYALFSLGALVHLLQAKHTKHQLWWAAGLAYGLACFILVLYPPFQIACGLASGFIAIGLILAAIPRPFTKAFAYKLGYICAAGLLAGLIAILFVVTRHEAISTIQNTTYPGKRVEHSGGFNAAHLLSGHLSFQNLQSAKADKYSIPKIGAVNQSENSNFLFLFPYLLIPSIAILVQDKRKKRPTDWALVTVLLFLVGAALYLFIPHLDMIGKLFLLNIVPLKRLLIGMGLIDFVLLALVIRRLKNFKSAWLRPIPIVVYCLMIFGLQLALGLHAKQSFPGFIGTYRSIAFALPVPVIMYLLLTKRFKLAALGLAAFTVFMSGLVHPLYRSTAVLTQTPLITTIKDIAKNDESRWAVEDGLLQNFPVMAGAPSLSGVFSYPQLEIWNSIDQGKSAAIYNRYAHTNFNFDRDPVKQIEPAFELAGGDHYGVRMDPCDTFLDEQKVKYILTTNKFSTEDACVKQLKEVNYPAVTIYIYEIN